MRRSLAFVVAVAAALLSAPPADACTPFPTDRLVLDPAFADDAQAPGAVTAEPPSVYRYDGAGCTDSGCGNYAFIDIAVVAQDDRAPTARLAYQVDVVGGAAPDHFWEDGIPTVPVDPSHLRLYLDPDASGFEFDLSIRAADLNGNLGPPTIVHVVDTEDSGGCAAAGRHRAAPLAAVALATLLATRRRRR